MDPEVTHIELTLEYPVSVEAILNVSFNYEGFKTIFEYILTVLRRHESSLSKQSSKNSSLSDELSDLRSQLQKTSELAKSLQTTSESHSSQLSSHETIHSSLSSSLEGVKTTVQNLEDSQKDTLNSVSALQKALKQVQGQVNDMDNLTQNLEAASFSQKKILEKQDQSLSEIKERLEKVEEDLSKQSRNFEHLKKELEGVAEKSEKHEKNINEINSKVERHTGNLNDHEKRIHQLELDIEQAMNAIKGLGGEVMQISKPVEPVIHEVQSNVDSSALNNVLDDLNELRKSLKDIEIRVSDNEDLASRAKDLADKNESSLKKVEDEVSELGIYLKKLEDLLKKSSGKQIDLSEIKSEVSKDDLDALKKLLKSLEDRVKVNTEDIENLKKQSKLLEEALKRKASLDDLDAIRHSSTPGQAVPIDLKALREVQHRLDDLSKQMQDLSSRITEPRGAGDPKALKDLSLRLDDLLKQLSSLSQRFDEQGSRLSSFEVSLNKKANKSDIDDLKKLFSSMDFKPSKGEEGGDSSRLLSLYKRIAFLEDHLKGLTLPEGQDLISIFNLFIKFQSDSKDWLSRLEKQIKDLFAKIKELEDLINKKVSIEDLKALEDLFKQKLKELAEEFMRKFAEKLETKRALKFLEKQIRETETFRSIPEGDDAMLARKPLGGWSCASCQKELEKLMGRAAPYQPWNRMPYRDPADRIARAGPGFSRMLASIQPESFTNRTKTSVFRGSSPPGVADEEVGESITLPPVKKADRPVTTL
jgi:DNA repair exonuclease SbcCD ATPase subunit